ncbi:hypothetical protein Trco_004542 [Trichoderma cornu-damae]|uniref:Uncharacterized protein n=1 Tax=Trichoderma cornu-damae TaxID=654480 RepID=A0A9P8TYC1_9HYPO|nr:hypothetical protein Trco_004542 [Trichoderma cornu-damae]
MLRRGSIYCEAVSQPQDIYYEGSEDEDYDDAVTRRQRCEAAGQQFLAGRAPLLLSATLRGPFGEESGWVNPWRSKHRTAHSQRRPPESQCAGSQHSHRRPAASALVEKRAMEALKSAENRRRNDPARKEPDDESRCQQQILEDQSLCPRFVDIFTYSGAHVKTTNWSSAELVQRRRGCG